MDASSLAVLRVFRASLSPVTDFATDLQLDFIITAAFDGAIRLWSLTSTALLWTMHYNNPLTCISFSHVPPAVYAGGINGSILLTSIPKNVWTFPEPLIILLLFIFLVGPHPLPMPLCYTGG